jgi:autotransporter-associated beta strand protein
MPGVEAVQQDAPNNGTNETLTANVATTVTVNLEDAVTYETVTVAGNAAVTFKKGGTATFKAGDITIGTDVTIEYGAVDVDTLIVNGGKTLTFDFTDYDFNSIYASKTLPLTGLATLGENATVTVALPTLPAYLTAECVFDANKSEYALAITVTGTLAATIENNAITWTVGNVEIDMPADFTALGTIPMTVVGENTLTLADIIMPSVTLTGNGEGAAVTFDSGKLTVTNTLTMNNVNVMATPDTLAAAVVMGTAGTETFTMYSRASYSHEQAFAMRFENCAFTKDGEGTFPIASSGFVLDRVNVTLKNGALQLVIGSGDPQIKDTIFTYVDANKNGVADGELTNHGWVHSTTTTTFEVPEGVTGKALVGSCLSDTGAVVKQGAGTLELGVMKTDNAGPYTGATTIKAGTLVYNVTNKTADALVMQGAITVKAGAAIKGSANCTLDSLILENGAIIDATDAPVVATTVTLPAEDGTVTVNVDAYGDVLTTTTDLDATKFVLANDIEGLLVVTENGLVYVATPDTGDVEFSAEVKEMLNKLAQAAAEYEGITSLTIEGITLSADGENVVKADIAGLELFEDVPVLIVPDGENGTGVAMVNYVFGINSVTVNAEDKIVVKASVDRLAMDNFVEPIEGEDAGEDEGEMPELPRPTFVNGVTVVLYNGNVVLGTTTITESTSEVTIESIGTYDTIFNPPAAAQDEGESATPSTPSSQTLQLTIKAVKQ